VALQKCINRKSFLNALDGFFDSNLAKQVWFKSIGPENPLKPPQLFDYQGNRTRFFKAHIINQEASAGFSNPNTSFSLLKLCKQALQLFYNEKHC
jgi:hypothetical protein